MKRSVLLALRMDFLLRVWVRRGCWTDAVAGRETATEFLRLGDWPEPTRWRALEEVEEERRVEPGGATGATE